MPAKQLAARITAIVLAVAFIAAGSVGAYYDVGGWLGVAIVWGTVAAVLGVAGAFVWALANWNSR